MELERLKSIWDESNPRPAGAPGLAKALDRSLGRLRRLRLLVSFELVQDLVGAFASAWFVAGHVEEPRFLLPGVVLLAGFSALLVSGLRQHAALRAIDWSAPVARIQVRLATLRVERLRAVRLTLLGAPLAFPPLLVVAARGFLGLDLWAVPAAARWLAANIVFGVAFLAGGLLLRRFLARRPWASRLARHLAGRTIAEAEETLAVAARAASGEPSV